RRVAALHVLSACCSHDPFVARYAGRDVLPPAALARIVEGEAALSRGDGGGEGNDVVGGNNDGDGNDNERAPRGRGSADSAVAAIALLVRLVVHWERREAARFFAPKILEDGAVEELATTPSPTPAEVEASAICRVAKAAFLWGAAAGDGDKGDEARPSRAALDLLAAWTASDLDALDAASDACRAPSEGNNSEGRTERVASRHRIAPEDVRSMRPRQVAAHRKREAERRRSAVARAVARVAAFCSDEAGGALDAALARAATTDDRRLRREVGLQRRGARGNAAEATEAAAGRLSCELAVEELDDDEEENEKDDAADQETLVAATKQGQLVASLLAGKPAIGAWALKHGWSDGRGVEELRRLIASDDPRAMSVASELVSAAASVESSRPLLAALVAEGTLEDLLVHPDPDVRSGAASCAAKVGLASKALSADEGEVTGLLDVAIELLFEEDERPNDIDDDSATKKEDAPSEVLPASAALGESTSMDRGVEVLAYLASKASVKERLAGGYRPPGSPLGRKAALDRLVEIACAPNGGDAQMAYGLAGIFNLLAVSIETLRKEAFVGKEITKEQYDQLQSLGKTEEEKAAEAKKDESEGDDPGAVRERIRKMAGANVPRAMVKLLEGSGSDAAQEKLLEGMGRMASEPSVRGVMIQQGCLTTCLRLDKGDKPNEEEKKILRLARTCVAKMLITTNPGILTVSQRSGAVGPLLKLVKDHDALDLMHFEALMSLTNLAGFDDETKDRIVAQKGVPTLSYAMFSDHEMVRRAATEAMCNMVPHPATAEHLATADNLRVWAAFALDHEEHFACARAALGGLAMAAPDPRVAEALVRLSNFGEMVRALLECGRPELMHRALALIAGLIEHGGKCREAVAATGAGPFCDAYVASYGDETKTMREFDIGPSERGSLAATLSLAKEVAQQFR
ncbi:hypothetical protein ACHAWF_006721, partial [Thalassiosira exigua]